MVTKVFTSLQQGAPDSLITTVPSDVDANNIRNWILEGPK